MLQTISWTATDNADAPSVNSHIVNPIKYSRARRDLPKSKQQLAHAATWHQLVRWCYLKAAREVAIAPPLSSKGCPINGKADVCRLTCSARWLISARRWRSIIQRLVQFQQLRLVAAVWWGRWQMLPMLQLLFDWLGVSLQLKDDEHTHKRGFYIKRVQWSSVKKRKSKFCIILSRQMYFLVSSFFRSVNWLFHLFNQQHTFKIV